MIFKLRREEVGLSQSDMAKRCGVSRQFINAIENGRNAIGIELNEKFYNAAQEIFDKWDDSVFECDDSHNKMIDRFKEQRAIGELNKEKGKAEKEEQKQMRDRKKELRAEIKELEAQLNALGMKKSEIKKLKEEVKEGGEA